MIGSSVHQPPRRPRAQNYQSVEGLIYGDRRALLQPPTDDAPCEQVQVDPRTHGTWPGWQTGVGHESRRRHFLRLSAPRMSPITPAVFFPSRIARATMYSTTS
jgi:hypothetical protein